MAGVYTITGEATQSYVNQKNFVVRRLCNSAVHVRVCVRARATDTPTRWIDDQPEAYFFFFQSLRARSVHRAVRVPAFFMRSIFTRDNRLDGWWLAQWRYK